MIDSQSTHEPKTHRPLDELFQERIDVFRAAYLNLVTELECVYHQSGASPDALNVLDAVTGLTPLALSARNNAVQASVWLIGHGVSVNQKCFGGKTALMHAVQCGWVQIIEVLIQNNADVNAQDDQGLTAFMYAACNGNMKIVDILVNAGAKVDQCANSSKSNAMMMAVISTQPAVVEMLAIKLGESVSSLDVRGRSALHHAVSLQSISMIERLVKLGADRNLPDKQGKTAADLATDSIRKTLTWV